MVEDKEQAKPEKKISQKDSFELTEVATQTAVVVKNSVTGDILTQEQVLALILNKLVAIERLI